MHPGSRRRAGRHAWRWGRFAEALAAVLLRAKGYRILARRYRSAAGEIDIVARRGNVIAFVEVKARPDAASAAEAVTSRQRRRLWRAALLFLAERPALESCVLRFDAMLIRPWRLPQHWVDAWQRD